MPIAYSAAELAAEAACPEARVHWLVEIGLLTPDEEGRFAFGAVLAVKMASALLAGGITAETIEHAASEGLLSFQRTDEYLPYTPGSRSDRTFAEFQAEAGPTADSLPAVYRVLGVAEPDPTAPLHVDEEAMFERFLDGWGRAPDPDSLIRAARLMAQGTRTAVLGWMELLDEQLARPARERLLRGELDRFPDDVRVAFGEMTALAPEMFRWLSARYLEHRTVAGIVEEFERFLASRGLAHPPDPISPPAIVFVDLSGFTQLTRELGDESAVDAATSLQRQADEAARRHGGRLVKLLGDGAMLRLTNATDGVDAALDLVEMMSGEGVLSSHAGVHAGPVIERDLDLFGQTVNLASRIADVAGPGEVLASEAVAGSVESPSIGFKRIEVVDLKGLPGPIALFRVTRNDENELSHDGSSYY
ncbi:MAG: adenylate/guanylate cyclase domain-containing protein [Acidimicrobiia bacterium]